jgi:hypothetical protein
MTGVISMTHDDTWIESLIGGALIGEAVLFPLVLLAYVVFIRCYGWWNARRLKRRVNASIPTARIIP